MTRRYLFILTGITLAVVFLMAFLHFSTDNPRYRKNGFNRTAIKTGLVKLHTATFDKQIIDVAGMGSGKLYLVTNEPGYILVADTGFHDIIPLQLNIEVDNRLRSNFTTTLCNKTLYIAGANIPGIIQYDLSTNRSQVYKTDRNFSRCAIINDRSAILRGFNASFDDEIFRKMNMPSYTYIEEKGITDRTEGGGFVTDGMLNYDAETGLLSYNYFYSNKLLFLDTGLHLLRTGTTIDTFKTYTASAKAIRTSAGVQYSFSKPPELLSLHSCVSEGKLYIFSRLKADNETTGAFRNNTIIDRYDITTCKYDGSWYVPIESHRKMLKFRIFDDLLVAIYPNTLITYQLPAHD